MARQSGKAFSSDFHRLYYPEILVWRMLKNRSPYISLHNTDELDQDPPMAGKTIYTFVPTKPRG